MRHIFSFMALCAIIIALVQVIIFERLRNLFTQIYINCFGSS